MQLKYNGKNYNIIIEKKSTNKNTYIRVKKDLNIYVTTSIFTSNLFIKGLIKDNYKSICDMIDKEQIKIKNNSGFFYLGKKYIIIHIEGNKVEFSNDKVYIGNEVDIDKWYKSKAKILFKERLDYNYNNFCRKIPYPKLRIRKMTTRWGVCNVKTHIITLNLELIKRDIKYLDYVIIHELSHLIYGDHSRLFWNLVGENLPNYKKYREEMKEF